MGEAAEKLEVFGSLDRNHRNQVVSEFPAWYFETHLDNMKEERDSLIRRLEGGRVSAEEQPYARAEAQHLAERIKQIEESRPEIRDNERATLQKHYKELANKIQDSMFTRSEMMMGTASANEEARRMVNPCIGLSPSIRPMATACNVKMDHGGKVSRNGAVKIWKIIARLIGEGSNVEALRLDKKTDSIKVH